MLHKLQDRQLTPQREATGRYTYTPRAAVTMQKL